MKVYQRIATLLQAVDNCKKSGNTEWQYKHEDRLDALVRNHMPSGAGFDNDTKLNTASTPNRLVFDTSFHHMHDNGMYARWTEHSVIVTPDLASGFDLKITGRDYRDIKDYIGEVFHSALNEAAPEHETKAA